MPARHINIFKTFDYTWTYEASADDDKISSTLKYSDSFVGWASRCPLCGSEHPDLPGLTLVTIKAAKQPGEIIDVSLGYSTRSSSVDYPGKQAGDPIPRYSVRFNGGEEHILTNPYANPLLTAERKVLLVISNGVQEDELAKLTPKITSELGLSLLEKILKGNVSYKMGGLCYVERKLVSSLSDINYSSLGKIDNPPGPAGGGPNSWLYESASADPDESGTTWVLEKSWAYAPNGWDTDLYG